MFKTASQRCNCLVITDKTTRVLKNVRRCNFHQLEKNDEAEVSLDYYKGLMVASESTYIEELEDALGPIDEGSGLAIEIGGGLSPYANKLRSLGYEYLNIEPNKKACIEMTNLGFNCLQSTLEQADLKDCNLILSAHSLEHVTNLELCISKILKAVKNLLYLVVPFGPDDLYNSDHNWFFTQESLCNCFSSLDILKVTTKRITKKERFIYLKAKA